MSNNIINPVYLEDDTINQLQEHFHNEPEFQSVTMTNFFTKEAMEKIIQELQEVEFEQDYQEMTHRRHKAGISMLFAKLLESQSFQNLINQVTGDEGEFVTNAQLLKFGHREYQIISDETILPPGMDIIIDLTPEWVDELGGIVIYTDGEGQFYSIPSNFGSVTLVKRTENLHYFIKYVNHYAENLNRYLMISNSIAEK